MSPAPFGKPVSSSHSDDAYARRLERLAWLMDGVLTIPGTKVSIGLDALLGLVPGFGDFATGIVQAALVLYALRHYRVPKQVAARMVGNVLIDVGVGVIPLLGDIFDVAFKANTRNVRLLQPYVPDPEFAKLRIPEPEPVSVRQIVRGTLWRYLLPTALVFTVVLSLVLIGTITVIRWLIGS